MKATLNVESVSNKRQPRHCPLPTNSSRNNNLDCESENRGSRHRLNLSGPCNGRRRRCQNLTVTLKNFFKRQHNIKRIATASSNEHRVGMFKTVNRLSNNKNLKLSQQSSKQGPNLSLEKADSFSFSVKDAQPYVLLRRVDERSLQNPSLQRKQQNLAKPSESFLSPTDPLLCTEDVNHENNNKKPQAYAKYEIPNPYLNKIDVFKALPSDLPVKGTENCTTPDVSSREQLRSYENVIEEQSVNYIPAPIKNLNNDNSGATLRVMHLPQSKLGRFIEHKVNGMIKSKNTPYVITVRVVSCLDPQLVAVKPEMKKRNPSLPTSFEYTKKTILCFAEVDGQDVWVFGFQADEYGTDCPVPNRGHVYLENLDSYRILEPTSLRTFVYHTIILGYLEYIRNMGYVYLNLCVGSVTADDSDTLMRGHCSNQKIPTFPMLEKWYQKLFIRGKEEGICFNVQDLVTYIREFDSLQKIPYLNQSPLVDLMEDILTNLGDLSILGDDKLIIKMITQLFIKEKKTIEESEKKQIQEKRKKNEKLHSKRIAQKRENIILKREYEPTEYYTISLNPAVTLQQDTETYLTSRVLTDPKQLLQLCQKHNTGFGNQAEAVNTTQLIIRELMKCQDNVHIKLKYSLVKIRNKTSY